MDGNSILDNYIASITDSRQLLRDMLSVLVQQESTLQTLIDPNINLPRREQTSAPSNVPIQPIWQSQFGRRVRATPSNDLPSRTNPIIDSSLNPTEDLLFANVPENDRYESCPITHEDFNNESSITRIRHCGHYFSRQAIAQWLIANNHCPICRHAIRPDAATNVNRETMLDNMLGILTRELLSDNRHIAPNSLIFHIDIADNNVD